MFDLPGPARFAGAAVLGFAVAVTPVLTAVAGSTSQAVAEPACIGSDSVVDGTPTCAPAPTAPGASDPQTGPIDSRQHDGGHH